MSMVQIRSEHSLLSLWQNCPGNEERIPHRSRKTGILSTFVNYRIIVMIWVTGRRAIWKFGVLELSRESTNQTTGCYFCLTKLLSYNNKYKKDIQYPDIASITKPFITFQRRALLIFAPQFKYQKQRRRWQKLMNLHRARRVMVLMNVKRKNRTLFYKVK